ncbi:zinc protease [Candidatus Magnetomorum sp. HK-1]|nr:zinc protease [Candidatus Magnetomorum sp. HK-1]
MTNLSIHKSILGNAIRVVTKNIPHAQTISMGVWVNVGARDESADENGLSHFIEHMIFKGTASRTAYQIAKELDAIGGQANAFTAMEHSCFYARFYHTHLDTIISILFDILLSSTFDPIEIDRERQVILQELRMMEDDPDDYANYLLGKAYWGNHSMGRSILGDRERIESFDSKTILAYFRERYSPDKIVIALAGKVDHDSVVERMEKAFGKVRNQGNTIKRKKPVPISEKIFHYRDQEQVQVCLGGKGYPLKATEKYIFTILNIILGGNMSSLLFQEIRERNALAYSVYSSPLMFSDCGMQNIYMGLEPSKVNEALRLVRQTLDNIIHKELAESTLLEAKEYAKATIQLSEESINNQMVRLGQNELFYGRYIPIYEILKNIECITPADIQSMAQDILHMDKMAMAFLGPIDEDSVTV